MPAPLPKLAVVLTATALLLASGAARATVEVQRAQRAPAAAAKTAAPSVESGGNRVTSTASTCPLTTLVAASYFGQAGTVPLANRLTTACSFFRSLADGAGRSAEISRAPSAPQRSSKQK
jgi:hypothetical protein